MNEKDLENLTEKYLKGKTSLHEESKLKEYYDKAKDESETFFGDYFSYLNTYKSENFSIPFQSQAKLRTLWRPHLAIAVASVLLFMVGMTIAWIYFQRITVKYNREIASMQMDIDRLQKNVMLQQLKNPLASKRMEAMQIAQKAKTADEQIIEAMGRTLISDEDINVRLAAAYALYGWSDDVQAKRKLILAINSENQNPLVQISLINMLLTLNERSAASSIKKAIQQTGIPSEDTRDIKNKINSWDESI